MEQQNSQRFQKLLLSASSSDVRGGLAPPLLSGDVPEAAVSTGKGKTWTPPPSALQHHAAGCWLAEHAPLPSLWHSRPRQENMLPSLPWQQITPFPLQPLDWSDVRAVWRSLAAASASHCSPEHSGSGVLLIEVQTIELQFVLLLSVALLLLLHALHVAWARQPGLLVPGSPFGCMRRNRHKLMKHL